MKACAEGGRGENSLLSDPGSELRIRIREGERETRGSKIVDGMCDKKKKMKSGFRLWWWDAVSVYAVYDVMGNQKMDAVRCRVGFDCFGIMRWNYDYARGECGAVRCGAVRCGAARLRRLKLRTMRVGAVWPDKNRKRLHYRYQCTAGTNCYYETHPEIARKYWQNIYF